MGRCKGEERSVKLTNAIWRCAIAVEKSPRMHFRDQAIKCRCAELDSFALWMVELNGRVGTASKVSGGNAKDQR